MTRRWVPYVGLDGQPLKTGYWKRIDPAPKQPLPSRTCPEEQAPVADVDKQQDNTTPPPDK
jgi:hypothetical protein